MAWIKIEDTISKKILTVPKKFYENLQRTTDIYKKVEEPKAEVKQKPAKPKEEKKDVQSIQLNDEDEVNSSGKNSKKVEL